MLLSSVDNIIEMAIIVTYYIQKMSIQKKKKITKTKQEWSNKFC